MYSFKSTIFFLVTTSVLVLGSPIASLVTTELSGNSSADHHIKLATYSSSDCGWMRLGDYTDNDDHLASREVQRAPLYKKCACAGVTTCCKCFYRGEYKEGDPALCRLVTDCGGLDEYVRVVEEND